MAGIADICQAQVCPDRRDNSVILERRDNSVIPDSSDIPNFEKCFRLLVENRRTYNQYNDSIFLIKDHVAWVNFFKRRALKNTQIFMANKEIISTMLDYFKKDKQLIPHQAYQNLCRGLQRFHDSGKSDPFLGSQLCDILLEYYGSGRCPENSNYAGLIDCYKDLVSSEISKMYWWLNSGIKRMKWYNNGKIIR